MQYRQLPSSSLSISEIGFGSGGNAGLMVRGSPAEQHRVMVRALELGINYFDTAPDYGNGTAETNLGRAFKALGVHPIVTSKVEIRRENLDDIAAHVVSSCENSLKRLQIERLDCLQIHNGPTLADPALEGGSYRRLSLKDFLRPRGALEGLTNLKSAGKIDCAGFICRPGDAEAVHELLETRAFHLINVGYSISDPSAGISHDGTMDDAKTHGVGCAVFSPLAGGYLSDSFLNRSTLHPLARAHDPSSHEAHRLKTIAQRVRLVAADTGLTLSQAAYRFILAHPSVTTVIGGFSSLDQVDEICDVSGMGALSPEDMARLETASRETTGP